MSEPTSTPAPPPLSDATPLDTGTRATDKIVVYRHSNLFYWWPVWLIGFIFALISYFDNHHLAIVPAGTVAAEQREIDVDGTGKKEVRDILILGKERRHATRKNDEGKLELVQPTIHIAHFRWVGPIFIIVLLLIITITNNTLRGLWTVLFILSVIMLTIMITLAGWWDIIFHTISRGRGIYINMGGYILFSAVLFVLWLINFLIFDRQTYMVFTPGQVRVRLEIGGEETVYDTSGMVVQRERGDLFRHWILGFGSGDLIIKPAGVAHPLLFPNVLRVEKIVRGVERMTKEKVILKSPDSNHPAA